MVDECHKKGIKVMVMVSTVEDAIEVNKSGADIIVAQGSEAGGHRSTWIKKPSKEYASIGTLALITQVSKKVNVPVVAAGGITDGKGVLGAISMGAEGVLMGTRFIATKESVAPDCHKQKILHASSDNTTVTDVFTGMYARVIRNTFTETYTSSQTPVLPPGKQYIATLDIAKAAAQQQNGEYYTLYAGQGIDNIREILSAGDVIQKMVKEALDALEQQDKNIVK
jgi:nitronate monooxygenase